MVLTRSQAARQQQGESENPLQPQPQQPRRPAGPLGQASKSKLNIVVPSSSGGMGSKPSKPALAREFPASHPISVPPSPAGQPGEPGAGPAHAAQLAARLAAACPAPAQPPAGQQPQPSERPVAPPGDRLPDGPEPVTVDVEYVPREELQPVEDPAATLEACMAGLEASDWVEAVRALNLLRQLAAHHPAVCQPQLDKLVAGVLKSVRSLRSSLCKTAIMAVADLYISYGNVLLPLTDVGGQAKPMTSVLAQVLLKCSSNDKKFVIEEAQRALQTMTDSTEPQQMLGLLEPYAGHKNPKVRGKAGGAVAAAVAQMQPLEVAGFGLPRLLQLSGQLITDNTPDARDAAKRLVGLLSAAFADAAVQQQLDVQVPEPEPAAEGEPEPSRPSAWEYYCRQHLNASAAMAVLKV